MDPENEPEAVVLSVDGGDPVAMVSVDALENSDTVSDDGDGEGKSDAVAIAEIEAEKEVAVAAINAGVEEARIEAEVERVNSWEEVNKEVADLRESMLILTETVERLQETLSPALASQLNPTPQPEPEAVAAEVATEVASEVESNSTHEFTLAPTSETQTEVTLESEDEKPVEALVTVRKRRRLI